MAARNAYVEFLVEQFSPLGGIESKAMFGGHTLYCDGIIFALVASGKLYLKVDDDNRGRFVERRLQPFKPFPDRDDVMSYYEAPPEVFEDADSMKDWVGSSVNAGRRSALAKPARRKRKPL
jgi:DNA transformation protein